MFFSFNSSLFANVPSAQDLFRRVNSNNPDSAAFKAHCVRVVNGLDLAINLLNDPPTLETALGHLADQHAARCGVTASAFTAIGVSFSKVLPLVIPGFNGDAWGSCFSKIADGISGGLPA